MLRFAALMIMFGLAPQLAMSEPLSYADFAAFPEEASFSTKAEARGNIVSCLKATRTPNLCLGVTLPACDSVPVVCQLREASTWDALGHDIYLRMRMALGGADWLDAAHVRISGEMRASCEAQAKAQSGRAAQEAAFASCAMSTAMQRTLDLRLALVAP